MSRQQTASRPRNLSHIAIGVRDMDASLRFYRDVIGLSIAVDHIESMQHPEFRTYRRGVYLRWADGDDEAFIVLDQTLGDAGDRGNAKALFDIGVHHFGFWVDDIDGIAARAESAGHEVMIQPLDADSGGYGEPPGRPVRVSLLRDPDGNVVQLDQRQERRG
jgi:catechol 2,3-dioxygenase-like lactoylglutathione lyase family enzyme